MSSLRCVSRWVVAITLLSIVSGANLLAQDAPAATKEIDWLRGEGASLEIRLQGEVLSAEGTPVEGAKMTVKMTTSSRKTVDLPVVVQNQRFEIWVPVEKDDFFTLFLEGVSRDGKDRGVLRLSRSELRRCALQGFTLRLHPVDRTVEIMVQDEGRLVADAEVRIESLLEPEFVARTSKDGVVRFSTSKGNDILGLTAWTDDHRIGGYKLGRAPKRDSKLDRYTIDLSKCRPQKIRVVNQEDNKPVVGVSFTLYVATAKGANFIGIIPPSRMTTDEKGEATFEWFPDWKEHKFYAEELDREWAKTGEDRFDAEGVIQVRVEKSNLPARKLVSGRVTSADGPVAGCCVEFRSPQVARQVQHNEDLCAFTDREGRFSLDVVPDAPYWGKILDEQLVSQIDEFLLFDTREEKQSSHELVAFEGNPVEVLVLDGANKLPMADVTIALFHTYEYTYSERGVTKRSTGLHQWWARTDKNGIAKSVSLPARSLRVRVMETDWDSEKTVQTVGGATTKVEFIRGAPQGPQLPINGGRGLPR